MPEIKLLSVVALLEDFPAKGLQRGQVGIVVEALAPGVYEVEFGDDSGRTYASAALRSGQLMQLHHEPGHQAA
jgi:membrane protein implicated in regulation of membrane protease activity